MNNGLVNKLVPPLVMLAGIAPLSNTPLVAVSVLPLAASICGFDGAVFPQKMQLVRVPFEVEVQKIAPPVLLAELPKKVAFAKFIVAKDWFAMAPPVGAELPWKTKLL